MSFRARRQVAALVFLIVAVGAGLAVAFLSGCSGEKRTTARSPDRPIERPFVGNQGGSWEAVFSTPMVAGALGTQRGFPEYGRNDAALNHNPARAMLATAQWPEASRPDLSRHRRLYLNTRPESIVYFESERAGRAWNGSGWDTGCNVRP